MAFGIHGRALKTSARLFSLFVLLLFAGASLYYALHLRAHRIEVWLPLEERVLYQTSVKPGYRFTYSFIHSVEQKQWDEVFEIGQDYRIYLVETAFGSLGAGLPYDAAGEVAVGDGKIAISGLRQPVPKLSLKASSFTSCTLTFGDTVVDLSAPDVAGKAIEVRVVQSGIRRTEVVVNAR